MYLFETHITVVVGIALALLAAVFVLQQRRTPQSMVAWLLFFLALPYLAIPVFLALGFRKQGSRFPPIRFLNPATAAPPATVSARDAVFQAFKLPPATGGNRLELLADGQDAFRAMMAVVESARTELDVCFYLIADDPIGRDFITALERKVRQGVPVRLIIDRLGGYRRPKPALDSFVAAGGRLHYFSPFLHAPDSGHLNLRNHRKMIIADRARVYAGGRNVGAEYLGPEPDPDRWADLSYNLQGPAVQTFLDVFQSDWGLTGNTVPHPVVDQSPTSGTASVQLVPSGPDTRDDALHDALVQAIHAATTRVWLVTPYFLPTEQLGQALATAARRGLDVRIVLPSRSNQRIADFARGAYLRELGDVGCKILCYTPGMLHAKAGIIDDFGWLGSANFDVRSMLLNFEMVLFVYDAASVTALTDWFHGIEPGCATGIAPASFARRVAEGVFRLGAPVL